jgi:hypothetical protein
MLEAVQGDWPNYLPVKPPLSVEWIEEFDEFWTADRVREVLDRSDPRLFHNDVLVMVCEMGVALGEVMRQAAPQLEWLLDWPYWESGLLDVPSGNRINVFHWAVKRFSEYGIDDGYGAKVRACIEQVRRGWDA